jgi:thiol:disulfide interchange protein
MLLGSALTFATPSQPPAPLPVDEAFPVRVNLDAGKITAKFDVLPGHYLYRDRFEVQVNGQPAGALTLPRGKTSAPVVT